jgi:hypothetical protein
MMFCIPKMTYIVGDSLIPPNVVRLYGHGRSWPRVMFMKWQVQPINNDMPSSYVCGLFHPNRRHKKILLHIASVLKYLSPTISFLNWTMTNKKEMDGVQMSRRENSLLLC